MTLSLLSLVLALGLAWWRPFAAQEKLWQGLKRVHLWLERSLNAGGKRHGLLAWVLVVGSAVVLAWLGHVLAGWLGRLFVLAWNVAVLYVLLGYFSLLQQHRQLASLMQMGDIKQSADQLAGQMKRNGAGWDENTVARLAIERLFLGAGQSLFGVALWFMLGSSFGPAGAVLYIFSWRAALDWHGEPENFRFALPAETIFRWLDGLSARMAAVSFAIVGDFEDALFCWRTQARSWGQLAQGIVLASAAGALGIKLGEPVPAGDTVEYRPEIGIHDPVGVEDMRSADALVWRALTLWLAVLMLLTLARWTT